MTDYSLPITIPENETLAEKKARRNKDIDIRTRGLILQGFTYDSTVFSMSDSAQRNWLALGEFRADLTYPFSISTKADGEYDLADETAAYNFSLTALGAGQAHYDSGRALKLQINAAADSAAVDAIVDNR